MKTILFGGFILVCIMIIAAVLYGYISDKINERKNNLDD